MVALSVAKCKYLDLVDFGRFDLVNAMLVKKMLVIMNLKNVMVEDNCSGTLESPMSMESLELINGANHGNNGWFHHPHYWFYHPIIYQLHHWFNYLRQGYHFQTCFLVSLSIFSTIKWSIKFSVSSPIFQFRRQFFSFVVNFSVSTSIFSVSTSIFQFRCQFFSFVVKRRI